MKVLLNQTKLSTKRNVATIITLYIQKTVLSKICTELNTGFFQTGFWFLSPLLHIFQGKAFCTQVWYVVGNL